MAEDTLQQEDTNVGAPLPFSGLDELKFGHVICGPRISLYQPRTHYGAITTRNYLAGFTKKSLRLKSKHISDLKAFVDLPVELQLLVLEHLHPIDLYHFSQVSRYFRQLVLDPAALGPVWKAAFMRHPDLPTPPPGVKEPEWAFMIYGPGICGVCGKYGALTDFSLQKRFCEPCLNAHTLHQRNFRDESNKKILPHHVIWNLIPFTKRSSGIRHSIDTARFLETDFSIMWKKLQLIRILSTNGLGLLSPLYKDYISARRDYIRKLLLSAGKSNHWADRIFRQLAREYEDLLYRLTTKCKTRLQALSYDEQDILSASLSIRNLLHETATYRLTRRAFREIRPRIEVLLRKYRIKRIKHERQRLLLNIYQDYLKSRPPDEWLYLPDVDTRSILDAELFKRFLVRPFDETVDITPGNVVPFLPEFIKEWIKTRRENFASILPNNPDETLEAKIQRLELVTSVVTCKTCAGSYTPLRPFVGWKSICRHQLNSKGKCIRGYKISQPAVAAATSLVSCLGLDPLTTTMDDLDRRDDRFMCGNCIPGIYRGRPSRPVYTWLECLKHTLEYEYDGRANANHAKQVWLPLSPAAARFVRSNEKPYPNPSTTVWRCNHCAHHFEQQVEQADAIDHVKRVHCIRIPAIGVDVVADPRIPIHKRREVFHLSLDPAYDHRVCKHCSDSKLWEKDIVIKHLIRRHHVPEPAEHVDWEDVPIIALSAAPMPT